MRAVPGYAIALVLGAALTAAAAFAAYAVAAEQNRMRLERRADVVERDVASALNTSVALLRSLDGMVQSRGLPATEEFNRYANTLQLENTYPGVLGLGFALDLGGGDIARAQAGVDAAGYPVRAWPVDPRERYTAIVLLEPQNERNAAALGYDMLSEERRRVAMLEAVRTGEPAITRPVRLVQEIGVDVQPGFLIYLPSRGSGDEFLGWSYSPFRAHDFFRSALAGLSVDTAVRIVDASADDEELYVTPNWPDTVQLRAERRIDHANAHWRIDVAPGEGFYVGGRSRAWIVVTLIGLFATFAGAGFMRWQTSAAERLQSALTEAERARNANEVLLKEVNHRVANSLALVSSLLTLQQRSLDSEESRDALQRAAGRIAAIARVHKDLYLSHGPTAVSSQKFLAALLEGIDSQLRSDEHAVTIEHQLDNVDISADRAIPLGIIMTELVTNAMKYAFPERAGVVNVKLQREGANARLRVTDDGVGFAQEAPKGSGLGSKIIDAMARQLSGEVSRQSGASGTQVDFVFPISQPQ